MTFTDALELDELLLVDRLTEHLERGVNQDALDATRRLSTAIEPGQPLAALAHALLALGEQGSRSLQGLVKLDSARKVLLDEACHVVEAAGAVRLNLHEWLRQVETRVGAEARGGTAELTRTPERDTDRLHYFLWTATRAHFGSDAGVALLLPICYRALRRRLRHANPTAADRGRGRESATVADDLPHQLAVFIRCVSPARLDRDQLRAGEVTLGDVRDAVANYRAAGKIAEDETHERYVRQIAETLDIDWQAREADSASFISFDPAAKRAFGFDPHRRVRVEEDVDEDGRRLGLVAWQEADDGGYESPFESTVTVRFGAWYNGASTRATSRWTTRERRVISPNEARRLFRHMDELATKQQGALAALLLWLAFTTGLPIQRLLNLRSIGNKNLRDIPGLMASVPEDFPVFLTIESGTLIATPSLGVVPTGFVDTRVYRPITSAVPLALGERGMRYATIAAGDRRRANITGAPPFVFRRPKQPERAMTLDDIPDFLKAFSPIALPHPSADHDSLSWARLRASLRPYAVEAGLTPLSSALASGRATRSMRTILHYVSYAASDFYRDHLRTLNHIESIISDASDDRDEGVPTSALDYIPGGLGAAYVPRSGLVAIAWQATCECIAVQATNTPERSNAATLRAAFALMVGTGLRAQELGGITRAHLDLEAALLRVTGKPSAYFREAREIALNRFVVEELRRYTETAEANNSTTTTMLFAVMRADGSKSELGRGALARLVELLGLRAGIPFDLRTLRHALRTELHDLGAPFEIVNEVFGHVTTDETIAHQLSGARVANVNNAFREWTQQAVSRLLAATKA